MGGKGREGKGRKGKGREGKGREGEGREAYIVFVFLTALGSECFLFLAVGS